VAPAGYTRTVEWRARDGGERVELPRMWIGGE
jgi:hypothetical protein